VDKKRESGVDVGSKADLVDCKSQVVFRLRTWAIPSSFRHASGLIGGGIDLSDAKLSISEVDDGMQTSDVISR
jgi:hypothetical protein